MNKVILLGNVSRVEKVETKSGIAMARIGLATNRTRKLATGEFETKTDWHNIKCFGYTAEKALKNVAKGDKVLIEGSLVTEEYNGDKYTEIVASTLELTKKKAQTSNQSAGAPAKQSATPPADWDKRQPPAGTDAGDFPEDDIPF